jgi:hypothetical protein
MKAYGASDCVAPDAAPDASSGVREAQCFGAGGMFQTAARQNASRSWARRPRHSSLRSSGRTRRRPLQQPMMWRTDE